MPILTLRLGNWGLRYIAGMLFVCHWFPALDDMRAIEVWTLAMNWTPSVRFLRYPDHTVEM